MDGEFFGVDVGRVDDGDLVTVEGDIDLATAPRLEAVLGRCDSARVVIDLGRVRHVDSSGLRVLLATHDRLDRAGRTLVLRNPSAFVQRLLNLAGLDGLLVIEADGQGPVVT
jgi:anti-sigma B factor antagonist